MQRPQFPAHMTRPRGAPSPTQAHQPQGNWSTSMYRGSRFQVPSNAVAYGNYTPQQVTTQASKMPTGSPSTPTSTSSESLSNTNLYIRGLTPSTTDKDLVNLCQQYGTIISTKAIVDLKTSECKGYGFVDFESPQAAENAVKALQAQGVQAQMAKQQEQDPTNLYIANLPTYMTESDLETIFSPFGQVISTRILRDPNGLSRGVGFARMESREKCDQIITAYHGKVLPGWKDALTVKFADSGQKKKNPPKPWVDRGDASVCTADNYLATSAAALAAYEQASAAAQNGVAPTVLTPPTMMQRYTMATTPVTSYQLPASWMYQPQLMQHHLGATAFLPGTMSAAAQAYNPALAYPQPQGTPIMQGIPTIDQWNTTDAGNAM